MDDFSAWLEKYGLTETFTTHAGDGFYTNKAKKFGVLRKKGQQGVQSFYLDDIVAFQTYDDEKLIAEWEKMTSWRIMERATRHSTNEVYMDIRLKNQQVIRVQIFKGTEGNISRDSDTHVRLFNYACQLSRIVYNCALGL